VRIALRLRAEAYHPNRSHSQKHNGSHNTMPDNHPITPAPPDALASSPTTEPAERRQIRVTSSPKTLLRLVPMLLGFHPEASMVIIGTQPPRGTVKVSLRYPLYDPTVPDVAAYYVGHALNLLTSRDYTRVVAIGYGSDERVTPFIELLREHADEHGLQLLELLRVEDNRYWSYACADPTCCPPEGVPFDPTPDPALTELLGAGVPEVLANREALAGLVAPVKGAAAQSMLRATRTAIARVAELVKQARASSSQHPIAPAGIRAVQQAITNYRQEEGVITHDEAAWLLVSLRDMWVRDDAWSRMEADHRQAHRRLWLDLTRLARPGYVAAPATLLAFVAWQSGNGALANVALDRALKDDPDYKMAQILRRTIDSGMDPSKAKLPMTPEQIAEEYSKSGWAEAEPHDRQVE
jgi:hypothetical protein